MAKKFDLERPELAEELAGKLASAERARDHQRLSAVRLGMSGELTLAQIAKAVGKARSTVAEWMRVVRASGLEALLALHQGRGRAPQLQAKAQKELRTGLRRGRWRRLKDAQQWLAERHRVEMGLGGVRYWVKKAGAVLRVPRKTHARQDPAQVEEFRRTFARRLCELGLPKERAVRVWVADEHRYGLIPAVRRSWGLRRVRTQARQLTRYEWNYTASALEVGGADEALVCLLPAVHTDWSLAFLDQIAQSDPASIHVVLWDGAGFHPADGAEGVPANVRLIRLPPYSPELNPAEKAGARLRRALAKRLPKDLAELDQWATEALRPLWEDPAEVRSLIRRGWLPLQVNASSKIE